MGGEDLVWKAWYSSTNKGGLSREKSLPLPLYGGLSLLQAGRECFLAVSLTRFFQGMAPDTMIRTIQPNGLYATADPYGSSRRLAIGGKTRARRSSVPYRPHSHKDVGMATRASPVISEIPARADQRHRKPGREAVPNHSDRDRPTRILGMTASLIDSCPK